MFKKYGMVIVLSVLVLGLLVVLVNRDKLYAYISESMQSQISENQSNTVEKLISEKYNYSRNQQNYQFTFLEFSSSACATCKRMEPVMEEMKKSEGVKANVVYIHTMKPENQDIMKYFGISATPMQIFLDKQGKEFFRNYGFISAADIELKYFSHVQKNRKTTL